MKVKWNTREVWPGQIRGPFKNRSSDSQQLQWRKGQAHSCILECQIIPLISRYHFVPVIPNNFHSFLSSHTKQLI